MLQLPVIFRIDRNNGECVAVFPTLPESNNRLTCYAHVGQHSECCLGWYRSTRPASDDERADLLRELTEIYTTRPQSNPETYGEPVQLVERRRVRW